MEWTRDRYVITDDRDAVDLDFVERMLHTTYWAPRRPRAVIEESVRNAVNFSVFDGERQVGFARVVSDGLYGRFGFEPAECMRKRPEGAY